MSDEQLSAEQLSAVDPSVIRDITITVLTDADKIASLFGKGWTTQIIETALDWVKRDIVWALLVRIISRGVPPTAAEVAAAVGASDTEGKPSFIDPALIIALITQVAPFVIELVKKWIAKRQGDTPVPATV